MGAAHQIHLGVRSAVRNVAACHMYTHARAAGASRQAAALCVLGKRSIGVAMGSDSDSDVEGLGVREIVRAVGVTDVQLPSQQPTTVPTRSLRPMLDHW
jgi:hypothetical protein